MPTPRKTRGLACCLLLATSFIHANDALVSQLKGLQTSGDVPAMGLVIIQPGREDVIDVYGDEVTAETPFRFGSITKTFTALTLLTLAENRAISMDDPAAAHLSTPVWSNRWAATHPVTLLQLLELTAGFADLTPTEFDFNEALPLAEALEIAPASRVTHWPPGLQHSYTNSAPGITTAIVEAISGKSFEAQMRSRVFSPLGMTSATLGPVEGLPGGFQPDGETEIPYWHVTYPAFGALKRYAA